MRNSRKFCSGRCSAGLPPASSGTVPVPVLVLYSDCQNRFPNRRPKLRPLNPKPHLSPGPLPRFAAAGGTGGWGGVGRFPKRPGSRLSLSFRKSILAIGETTFRNGETSNAECRTSNEQCEGDTLFYSIGGRI